MPTFSQDDVVDFCVAEAVVRAGMEAEREAQENAEANAERNQRVESHRSWAEEHGLLNQGGR